MRLGKDLLELDLYRVLGVLPDATAAELRVAYRRAVRESHPDLNPSHPEAMARTKQLNAAARVLLDPALRRAYDRHRAKSQRAGAPHGEAGASGPRAWFERAELGGDDEWVATSLAPPPDRLRPGAFGWQLRGREGLLSLRVRSLLDSLSPGTQLACAAALCALALGFIAMSAPRSLSGKAPPTTVNAWSLYP